MCIKMVNVHNFDPEIQLTDMCPTEIYVYRWVQRYKYSVVHFSIVSDGEHLNTTQMFISKRLLK